MAKRRPADAIVLTVRPNTTSAEDPNGHALHHFTAFGQADPPRTLLFGFGYGGELAGLPRGADEGIALLSDAEVGNDPSLGDPDLKGPIYQLRFDHYLERLRKEQVNYVKVLLFDVFKPHWSPYATDTDAVVSSSVSGVNTTYLDRLEELVRKARTRGILVNVSLFASRMLRTPGWSVNPFNAKNNNTGDILGNGGFISGDPMRQFCVIRKPPDGRAFWQMSVDEKLYTVQRELVTRIVDTTQRYWNVVYEICDDPRGPGDEDEMLEVTPWHATVAGWIADTVRDRHGRRRRCLEVNAGPRLRGALLDALGARTDGNGTPLVDLVHLRGGEWGGYPGDSLDEVCAMKRTEEPAEHLLTDGAITDGVNHREVSWDGVEGGIGKLGTRPVAVVLDADRHHLAQKYPGPYVAVARGRWGHFLYRWSDAYLHQVDVDNDTCDKIGELGQVCPAKGRAGYYDCVTFGLDQRLDLVAAPDPEARVTQFPLPPPYDEPRNVRATVEGDYVYVTFDPPPVAPEGYALFVGDDADSVWMGNDLFPDPLQLEQDGARWRARMPSVTRTTSLFVAVAATRGVLTSDLSDSAGPVQLMPKGAELVGAEFPSEVETRHDFSGTITFRNDSEEVWAGRSERDGVVTRLGAYLQAEGLSGGLANLFIPMPDSETVGPGAQVVLSLGEILLDGPLAEHHGARIPMLLPYSRKPIRFRVSMARREERPTENPLEPPPAVFHGFGEAKDALPDGRPFQVTVKNPSRLAIRHVPEAQELFKKSFVLPLADGVDRALHLTSVVAKDGKAGTIIRAVVQLERLVKEAGFPTRVLSFSQTGADSVHIDVDVMRLQPIDVYYGIPVHATRHRLHDLAAAATDQAPLGDFGGGYTITIASSDSLLHGGETIRWESAALSATVAARLLVHNTEATASKVVSFTAELAEDTGSADPREMTATLTFAPGDGPKYVPLGAADQHRFFVPRLSVDGTASVTADIVLRADDAGAFQRELEVRVADAAAPVTVTCRILEVPVDPTAAKNRKPADLHPAHAARILEFFNNVEEPKQIVDTIRDNRSYRRDTRRAYAVRAKLAQSILAARKKKPDGRFTDVAELDAITGIGEDTFEDIAYTFQDDGTPV